MKEKTLYSYWETRATEEGPFKTEQGEPLTIISPGRRNTGSGPDYKGCILDVDGEIHTGEVEIHVRERDWKHHGHNRDDAFDHVKLHFFLMPDSERVAPGQIQRTVQLEEVPDALTQTSEGKDTSAVQTLCPAGHRLKKSPGGTRTVLSHIEKLGKKRIRRRAELLRKRIQDGRSRMEVLACVLCECVCLRRNHSPARSLARNVEFPRLRRRLQGMHNPDRAQLFGEGVLLNEAGLLRPGNGPVTEPDWTVYRSKLTSIDENKTSSINRDVWNCSDVRPVNTPFRRLAGFVALFRRFLVDFSIDHLEDVLIAQVKDVNFSEGLTNVSRESDLLSFLTVTPDQVYSYWNQHSQPGEPFDQPMGLIGKHRAAVIWINGVLPYLFAMARSNGRSDVAEKLWSICQNGQLPLGDRRSKSVRSQLFGSESSAVPTTAFMDQGQHELHKSFCRFGPSGCSRCPLNEKLQDRSKSVHSSS